MKNRWTWGLSLAAVLVISGMILQRVIAGRLVAAPEDTEVLTLRDRNASLTRELDLALQEAARWRALAEGGQRTPVTAAQDAAVDANPVAAVEVRDAAVIRTELADAARRQEGAEWLGLLLELAALGDEHYPEVAAQWSRLVSMSAGDLDALGLSRIDLTSALASEAGLIRFTLEEPGLDPTFRQFTAEALALVGFALRRSILTDLDFAAEKDRRVLTPLVRASQDIKGPDFVDRYLRLVQRTDLYNDMRHSVAFMIAEIDGDEAFGALEVLRASGGYPRIVPVLASIHSPPATGLLVTNGLPPDDGRIGHNDVLLEYNGQAIRNLADLTRADSTTRPGDVVPVRVFRDGSVQVMYVTVTDTAPGHLHFDGRPIVKKG